MSAPPGQERRPSDETEAADVLWRDDNSSLDPARDIVPLGHGLSAVYVRDTDVLSVARRRFRRCHRQLTGPQLVAYESWLAEQRQAAS